MFCCKLNRKIKKQVGILELVPILVYSIFVFSNSHAQLSVSREELAEYRRIVSAFKVGGYFGTEAEDAAARIRAAVSEGRITWDEIGITEEELGILV